MGKFLYFGYGSNLLSKRLLKNNPSAKRVTIGKLHDYQLNFDLYSDRWKGACATIAECKGSAVWGAIWEIDSENLESLYKQEGVNQGLYEGVIKDIEVGDGKFLSCRLFKQTTPPVAIDDIKNLPKERLPSLNYLNIIIDGAKESNLPEEYQAFLKTIPHNGYNGEYDIDAPL